MLLQSPSSSQINRYGVCIILYRIGIMTDQTPISQFDKLFVSFWAKQIKVAWVARENCLGWRDLLLVVTVTMVK